MSFKDFPNGLNDLNEYLDEQGHQKAIASYPWLSTKKITKAVDEILKEYYISKDYIPIALRQVLRKHGLYELRRLWYSVTMFVKYMVCFNMINLQKMFRLFKHHHILLERVYLQQHNFLLS